jgi:hypothetical protein
MKDPFASLPDGDVLKAKCRAAVQGDARAKSYLRGALQVLVKYERKTVAEIVRHVLRRAT